MQPNHTLRKLQQWWGPLPQVGMSGKLAQVVPVDKPAVASDCVEPAAASAPTKGAQGEKSWGVVRSSAAAGQSATPRRSVETSSARASVGLWESKKGAVHPALKFGNKFLRSFPVTFVMMGATFWTLIADDIRIATNIPMVHDDSFMLVTSVCFFLFAVEIAIALVVKRGYPRSAYFLFDVVATLTLIAEMPWVIEGFMGPDDGDNGQTASEASSTARTVRLLRVVRLIRLVRLIKLYKYALARLLPREPGTGSPDSGDGPSWQDNPSAVGRALQESITLQVVVGVLLMLIVFPLISVTEARAGFDYDLELVSQLDALWRAHRAGSATASVAARRLIDSAQSFQHLAYFRAYDGTVLLENLQIIPPAVREVEYAVALAGTSCASGSHDGCSLGGFFKRADLVVQAQFSLGLLAFVVVLLIGGVVIFNRIATRYCIAPIEKLFAIVNSFAKDPMAKLGSFGDDTVRARWWPYAGCSARTKCVRDRVPARGCSALRARSFALPSQPPSSLPPITPTPSSAPSPLPPARARARGTGARSSTSSTSSSSRSARLPRCCRSASGSPAARRSRAACARRATSTLLRSGSR